MPAGVLEMNPAIPQPALGAPSLRRRFAGYFLLRNPLAQPLLRFFRRFVQADLPQKGSAELVGLMVSHVGAALTWTSLPVSRMASWGRCLGLIRCKRKMTKMELHIRYWEALFRTGIVVLAAKPIGVWTRMTL